MPRLFALFGGEIRERFAAFDRSLFIFSDLLWNEAHCGQPAPGTELSESRHTPFKKNRFTFKTISISELLAY